MIFYLFYIIRFLAQTDAFICTFEVAILIQEFNESVHYHIYFISFVFFKSVVWKFKMVCVVKYYNIELRNNSSIVLAGSANDA